MKTQKNLNATLTEIGSDDDAVALLDDGEDAQADEGQGDAFVVHFDFHVLSQRHFQVFNLRKKRTRFWLLKWGEKERNKKSRTYGEGDGLCPGEGARGTGVVGDSNGETVVAAVGRQQVFAGALEVEDAPVERPVVRVAENGAHGVVCKW